MYAPQRAYTKKTCMGSHLLGQICLFLPAQWPVYSMQLSFLLYHHRHSDFRQNYYEIEFLFVGFWWGAKGTNFSLKTAIAVLTLNEVYKTCHWMLNFSSIFCTTSWLSPINLAQQPKTEMQKVGSVWYVGIYSVLF